MDSATTATESSAIYLRIHFKDFIIDTATNIFGLNRKKTRNDWYSDGCQLASERKNAVYQAMKQS